MKELLRNLNSSEPRQALLAACHLSYIRGLVAAFAGNASVRYDEGFICTPAGCCLGEVAESELVSCDRSWHPVSGGTPTSEWRLHARIYGATPEVAAVLHTHSPFATVQAMKGVALVPFTVELTHYLGEVPCLAAAPPGSEELAAPVALAVGGGARALLLARHGAVVCGRDMRSAFHLADLLEFACSVRYKLESSMGDLLA